MDELIQRLEKKVKSLIDQHDQLKQSNQKLHHGQHTLAQEKDELVARQRKAATQIEALVSKLKAIEKIT